jgi:hypothetical protein
MDVNVRFSAIFTEGYVLRNLIEYLKSTNQSGTFFFSKDKITYRQSEANRKIINKVEIDCKKLCSYEFNDKNSEIPVSINLQDMLLILKHIGKKDSIKISQRTDEPAVLYFQSINSNFTDGPNQNISLIRLQCINALTFEEPTYSHEEMNPNIYINNQNFVKIWKTFSSMRCENVNIIGKEKGIMLVSISKGQIVGRIEKIGDIKEDFIDLKEAENDSDCAVITISSSTMKHLCKIGNLTQPQTAIKLFIEKEKPLKILTHIGSFGKLTTFVYSNS